MPLQFDEACQAAINMAKRMLADGAKLDIEQLAPSLLHTTELRTRLPRLASLVQLPAPMRPETPESFPVSDALAPVFRKLMLHDRPVTAGQLLLAVLDCPAGRDFFHGCGATDADLDQAIAALEPGVSAQGALRQAAGAPSTAPWRSSPERKRAIGALGAFGRFLTESEIPDRTIVGREKELHALIEILYQMGRRNAIILGFPGTGKSALVFELARRIINGHSSIPQRLRDIDIFELSPVFLRSGASYVGQYEERVKSLLKVLTAHPKIILFVDEIHSLFQSGIHDRGPFSDANEAFKVALGRDEITCIGTSSKAEYRRFIEPDRALVRRFGLVHLDPPAREATIDILKARRRRMEDHYAPLTIPDSIVERAVELSDEHLPELFQPDKSIQLLDAACAACAISQPPPPSVTERSLIDSLADFLGYEVADPRMLTSEAVYEALTSKLVGEDMVLREIARSFAAGLDRKWLDGADKKPRGVFMFGGPTGTGKTAVALMLARLLGGGRDNLIRIDCNTLQGAGFDSGPSLNRLLGVPPGYVGYAPGQGGLLSRIRDYPCSVVLFDEFEKADPGVGEILLRILDEGRTEDVEGRTLDFRQSFVIFTTNAGTHFAGTRIAGPGQELQPRHEVRAEEIWKELRDLGLGAEFESRMSGVFVFRPLDVEMLGEIATRFLRHVAKAAGQRGLEFTWDEAVVPWLVAKSEPRLGARNIKALVHTRIVVEIKVAETARELDGVKKVRVVVGTAEMTAAGERRRRSGDTLEIILA